MKSNAFIGCYCWGWGACYCMGTPNGLGVKLGAAAGYCYWAPPMKSKDDIWGYCCCYGSEDPRRSTDPVAGAEGPPMSRSPPPDSRSVVGAYSEPRSNKLTSCFCSYYCGFSSSSSLSSSIRFLPSFTFIEPNRLLAFSSFGFWDCYWVPAPHWPLDEFSLISDWYDWWCECLSSGLLDSDIGMLIPW